MATFEAGAAFVTIMPSMKGFNQRVRSQTRNMPNAQVPIEPEVNRSAFTRIMPAFAKAGRQAGEAFAKAAEARKAKLDADISEVERKVNDAKRELDELGRKKVDPKVDADIEAAKAKITLLRSQLDELANKAPSPKVDADTAAARAKILALQSQIDRLNKNPTIRVDAEYNQAKAKFAELQAELTRLRNERATVEVDADTRPATTAIDAWKARTSAITQVKAKVDVDTTAATAKLMALSRISVGTFGLAAATTALLQFGAAIGPVAGALAGLPGIAAAGAGALGALFAGTRGLGGAFSALKSAQDSAGSSAASMAKQQQSAARQIASAQDQVKQARTALSRAYQDAAWSEADAERQVIDAERSLVSAQRTAQQAQQDLTRAREEARRAMQDLNFSVAEGAIAERQAVLDLRDAQKQLQQAQAQGVTGDQLAKLQVAYDRQALSLQEIRARNKNLAKDQTAAAKAGVEGSDQVVSAQQRVRDANESVRQAQQQVAQAREAQSRQAVQSQRSIADAQRAVVAAQQQLTQALADSGNVGAEAGSKVADAMGKLSPSARAFVNEVQRLKPAWQGVARAAQEALFKNAAPGFAKLSSTYIPVLRTGLSAITGEMNTAAHSFVNMLTQGRNVGVVSSILSSTAGATHNLGAALAPIGQAFLDISQVGAQVFQQMTGGAGKAAQHFADLVAHMKETGRLQQIITAGFKTLGQLVSLLGHVGSILASIFTAAGSAGANMLTVLNQGAGSLAAFLRSAQGMQMLQGLFGSIATGMRATKPLFDAIGNALKTSILPALQQVFPLIGRAIGALAPAIAPLAQLLAALAPLLGQIAVIIAQHLAGAIQTIAPLLTQFVNWLARSPGLATGLAVGLFGLVKSIGPLLGLVGALGTVFNTVNALKGVLGGGAGLSGIVEKLGGAFRFLLGPVGIIIGIFAVLFATNEQFRGAVMRLVGVFGQLIGQVVSALMPVFNTLVQVFQQVLAAVMPLFNALAQALVPIINTLAQLFSQLISALLPPFMAIIQALMPVITTIGQIFGTLMRAIAPILGQLARMIGALLPPLIQIIGSVLVPIIRLLANVFSGVLGWVIKNVVMPVLQGIVYALNHLGDAMNWLWKNVIKPVWDAIGGAIHWVWVNILKPVFDFFGRAIDNTRKAFENFGRIVTGIWTKIKNAVKHGVQIVIDIVWNNSLRRVAQLANKIPGVGSLIPDKWVNQPIKLAKGGVVPGYKPGKDTVPAVLSPGEAVLVPEAVAALGSKAIDAINRAFAGGRIGGPGIGSSGTFGAAAFARGGIVQRFADGGVVGAAPAGGAAGTAPAAGAGLDPAALAAANTAALALNATALVLNTTLLTLNATLLAVTTRINTQLIPALVALGARLGVLGQQTTALQLLTTRQWALIAANVLAAHQRMNASQNAMNTFMGQSWNFIASTVNGSVSRQNASLAALRNGMAATRNAMQATADWATWQYGRIKAAAANPVRWVLQQPFNAGIIAAWNKLDHDFAFNKHVNPVPIGFAHGGKVRGPGTATSDSIPANLSHGEFVVRASIAKQAMPFLSALNAGDGEALQATGGPNVRPARRKQAGRNGIGLAAGGPADARIASAKHFLSTTAQGIPYVYGGGTSTRGTDCSGMQSMVTHILSGRSPFSGRLGSTATMPWSGFAPGLKSAYAIGSKPHDHMAGTLAGQNVEQHGPNGTPFHFPSRWGADNGYFTQRWHLPVVGGQFVSGGAGGGIDPAVIVNEAFKHTLDLIAQGRKRFPGNTMAVQALDIANKATEATKQFAVRKIGETANLGSSAGAARYQAYARSQLAKYGWGPDQMAPLIALWNKESGWNPTIANSRSGAYGIPQSLPGNKMAAAGADWRTNGATQINWGLGYIKGRYHSPAAAWAHSQQYGWYDQGGVARGAGLLAKGTLDPERVLSPHQTRAFDDLVSILGRSGMKLPDADADRSYGPTIENLYATVPQGATVGDLASAVNFTVRHGTKSVHSR